jgi:hypothetical protein
MTADPILVLAGLALTHLVADFLLQSDAIVADKAAPGRRALRGLGLHGLGVAACLVPFVALFAERGLAVLVAITVGHVLVDRLKATATRRAEARALAAAHTRHATPSASAVALGPGWTPVPAALFVADQVVHGAISVTAWAIWLAGAAPTAGAVETVDRVLGEWDRAVVHDVVLTAVVLAALAIVNVRAGALFVAILVHPREVVRGMTIPDEPPTAAPATAPRATGWRIRLGPFEATADPAPTAAAAAAGTAGGAPAGGAPAEGAGSAIGASTTGRPTHASPARVGATIGIIERLLIATFVLTGSQAAIGFVVAAKTLARFKQLDDRDFAEYYLLGTLASVAVALFSALLAAGALASLSR